MEIVGCGQNIFEIAVCIAYELGVCKTNAVAGKEIMFQKTKYIKGMLKYLKMTVATVICSVGISLFLDPNALAPGGVTGVSIILNRVTGVETGTWILLLNIPILILGIWKFGVRFILSTVYCIVLVSAVTNILAPIGAVTTDPFLAAIAGSSLMALGLGLVFKAGGTTGGTDIIIKVLRLKFPYLKTGSLFLFMDASVVLLSFLVLKDVDKALYAGMAVFVTSFVLDLVLYGRDEAKLIYIISDSAKEIAARILEELNIGATYVKGSGAYSGKEKDVIICVTRKQLSYKAEAIVKEVDASAFMIISSATEIYGEGYKSYFGERL